LFFLAILATMMVPFFIILVPLYVMVVGFGWIDNYLGLIMPLIYTAFGIFLLRQFSMTIPDDLLDAARIDGGSEIWIFFRVSMPLLRAPIGALGIFTFTGIWGDFLWPLFIISKAELRTLPLALSVLTSINPSVQIAHTGMSRWGILMAGDLIAVVPVLVVFFLFQRHITQGVTLTGLAGQ
jgi:ABC-type sugar transport system, permease component